MERKQFMNLVESARKVLVNEDHMTGKTVIVKGKKGVVGKEVSSDGKTENDEIYKVKFDDGSVENIPARDMEMSGDTKNKKQPSENEAEDITNESIELAELDKPTLGSYAKKAVQSMRRMEYQQGRAGQKYAAADARQGSAHPDREQDKRQLAAREKEKAKQEYLKINPKKKRRMRNIERAIGRLTTEDYQCPKELEKHNMKGAGVGIPAINNKVFGTKGFTKENNKLERLKAIIKKK